MSHSTASVLTTTSRLGQSSTLAGIEGNKLDWFHRAQIFMMSLNKYNGDYKSKGYGWSCWENNQDCLGECTGSVVRADVGLVLPGLLLSQELSQDVRVLDVVRKRVDHGVVAPLMGDVEVVAGCVDAVVDDRCACHHSVLVAPFGRQLVQVLFVLAHLHVLSRLLVTRHLLRCESYLLELFLLLDSTLILLGVHEVLLVQLPIELAPVTLLHVLQPLPLGLHPLLAPFFLLLYAILDKFLFEVVPFVVELDMVLGDAILIIKQHLVILNRLLLTFL